MKIELPDTEANALEYRCFCGFRGTYAERDAHREMHKSEKKR